MLLIEKPRELVDPEQQRKQQRDQHGALDHRRTTVISKECSGCACQCQSPPAGVITDRAAPSRNCRRHRASPARSVQHRDRSATAAAATLERVSQMPDRKSTRLNSSHMSISYAVFCLKKKTE